jgi:hypothetical protein
MSIEWARTLYFLIPIMYCCSVPIMYCCFEKMCWLAEQSKLDLEWNGTNRGYCHCHLTLAGTGRRCAGDVDALYYKRVPLCPAHRLSLPAATLLHRQRRRRRGVCVYCVYCAHACANYVPFRAVSPAGSPRGDRFIRRDSELKSRVLFPVSWHDYALT